MLFRSSRGVAKGRLNDYSDAIIDLNKAIEINPRYAEAYNDRGVAKRGLKDYDSAIADFDKAIEINPNYTKAIASRAEVQALKK